MLVDFLTKLLGVGIVAQRQLILQSLQARFFALLVDVGFPHILALLDLVDVCLEKIVSIRRCQPASTFARPLRRYRQKPLPRGSCQIERPFGYVLDAPACD